MSRTACPSCGTSLADEARFCQQCGNRIGAEPILIDLEGHSTSRRAVEAEPTPSRGPLFAVVGPVLLIAALAVWLLGGDDANEPDEPEATPAEEEDGPPDVTATQDLVATTSERRTQEAIGALEWVAGPELGTQFPAGFVELNGETWLYTGGSIDGFGSSDSGFAAWRRADAADWESVGTLVDPPARVDRVIPGPDGLLAAGKNNEGDVVLWRSSDGAEWSEDLVAPAAGEFASVGAPSIATNGEVTLVAGRSAHFQASRVLREPLRAELGEAADDYSLFLEPGSASVQLFGPFGLRMADVPLAQLGFDAGDLQTAAATIDAGVTTSVWRSDDVDWSAATFEGQLDLLSLADGSFLLTGWGPRGPAMLRSADGVEWVDDEDLQSVDSLSRWGEGLIGLSSSPSPHLRINEGGEWRTVTLGAVLPAGINRIATNATAGDSGVAVTIRYREEGQPSQVTATLVKDGLTLTVDPSGLLSLTDDTGERARLQSFGSDSTTYRADVGAATVTLLDLVTGEDLITYTVEELQQLQGSSSQATPDPRPELLAITTDTQTWSLNWLEDIADGPATIIDTAIVGDQVMVTVMSPNPAGWTNGQPSFQIFTAELP